MADDWWEKLMPTIWDAQLMALRCPRSNNMTRIPNRDMDVWAARRAVFKNNNNTVWSERREHCYVVFSYGQHFPMYVYDRETELWFANKDKYSPTTSCHMGQAQPTDELIHVDTDTMIQLASDRCKDKGRVVLLAQAQQGD